MLQSFYAALIDTRKTLPASAVRSAPAAAVLRGGASRAPILGGRVRRFVSHTALCPLSCVGSCAAGRAGRTGTVGMERGASGRSQPTAPSGPALRALRWPGKGPVWPPRPQPADVDSGPVAVATGGHSARRKCTMGSMGDRGEHAATTHRQRRADHGRALRPPVLGVGSRRQLNLGVIALENLKYLATPIFPSAHRVVVVVASPSCTRRSRFESLKKSASRLEVRRRDTSRDVSRRV